MNWEQCIIRLCPSDTEKGDSMTDLGPLRFETICGKPLAVFGRTLAPVVRAVSVTRHRGTIRSTRVDGRGNGTVLVRPLGVIETRDDVEQFMPISDLTSKILCQMALVALIVSIISLVLMVANRLEKGR
jgi:hypothetical protein